MHFEVRPVSRGNASIRMHLRLAVFSDERTLAQVAVLPFGVTIRRGGVVYSGAVTRLFPLALIAVGAVLVATGCAGSARTGSTSTTSQRSAQGSVPSLPLVVAHPTVQLKGLPKAKVRHLGTGGKLISPTQLAFTTSGSTGCLWLPARLTVLSQTAIRIDMRFPHHRPCLANYLVGVPIAVKLNPLVVNVHRPLNVRLVYKATYCCGEPSKTTYRIFKAAAVRRV
jgi:hypothetical protein